MQQALLLHYRASYYSVDFNLFLAKTGEESQLLELTQDLESYSINDEVIIITQLVSFHNDFKQSGFVMVHKFNYESKTLLS